LQRGGEIALRLLHVADLVVAHRQIALPAGIAGVGFGQPLSDGERGCEKGSNVDQRRALARSGNSSTFRAFCFSQGDVRAGICSFTAKERSRHERLPERLRTLKDKCESS
jgi:hypothetical protein